jgi:ATP-dependent Lhr-like helicase
MASVEETTADAVFALVRRAYPYHRLPRQAFDDVLAMLAGKYRADLTVELVPRLRWDRLSGRLRRDSRQSADGRGRGARSRSRLYTVHLPDRTRLGELDEEFVHESRSRCISARLGHLADRGHRARSGDCLTGARPPARMPFWRGEYSARSVG